MIEHKFYQELAVQCVATLTSGYPCRREAKPDSTLCKLHQNLVLRRQARARLKKRFSLEAERHLAEVAQREGVDAEIAAFRILIDQKFQAEDIKAVRPALDTLARLIRLRHHLDKTSSDRLEGTLERVLDTLGEELGVDL